MDKYQISQTPGKKAPKKAKAPARRQTRSLNSRTILSVIVIVAALALGGLVWARFFNNPNNGTADNSKSSASKPKATLANVSDAISSKKPGGLNGLYASKVHVVIVGGSNKTLSASQVEALISSALSGAKSPWNWHVPASTISSWQQGPYGSYFDGNNIIGESSDGTVVSVVVDSSGQITGVFIAPESSLTGSGGSTSSSSSSGSTSDSTSTSGGSSSGTGTSSNTTTPTVSGASD